MIGNIELDAGGDRLIEIAEFLVVDVQPFEPRLARGTLQLIGDDPAPLAVGYLQPLVALEHGGQAGISTRSLAMRRAVRRNG